MGRGWRSRDGGESSFPAAPAVETVSQVCRVGVRAGIGQPASILWRTDMGESPWIVHATMQLHFSSKEKLYLIAVEPRRFQSQAEVDSNPSSAPFRLCKLGQVTSPF